MFATENGRYFSSSVVYMFLFVSNLIGNNYMNVAYKYQKSESFAFYVRHLSDDK